MKTKKITGFLFSLIFLASALPTFAACGSDIEFTGAKLEDATVGVEYSQVIDSATCSNEEAVITYSIKEGTSLPVGLLLKPDGTLEGTPRNKTNGAVEFTVVASAEGSGSAEAQFTLEVKEGKIVYANSDVQMPADKEYTVSAATATGAESITYTLKEGSTLPAGVTLSSDGTLKGTATTIGETTVTVVASATDCKSAEAQLMIKVVQPWLEYEGTTLANGRVDEYYSATVATATGTDGTITYTLKEGSQLQTGLTLSSNGLISGTPSQQLSRNKFTVVASAQNFTSSEAEFTLTVLAASQGAADAGTIAFTTRKIEDVYVGEEAFIEKAVRASTDNRQTVTFAVKDASKFPAGLSLLPNGTISGSPEAKGEFTFTVTASAPGCPSVDVEFKINVLAPKITFNAMTAVMATLDEAYTFSIAKASVKDGTTPAFTYTASNALPQGLALSADGVISGTPAQMVKDASITVTVSAEGYTSATSNVLITVQDKIHTGVTRFEAEHWDLSGMTGGGYSGSQQDYLMIQNCSMYNASNGYAITYTHSPNTFKVKFNSSAAASGVSLYVGMDTELGDITLNNSVFDIRVNGVSITYSVTVPSGGGSNAFSSFNGYLISSDVALKEGENVIELEVMENLLLGGSRTGGPALDYIEFKNLGSAELSWRPKTINVV